MKTHPHIHMANDGWIGDQLFINAHEFDVGVMIECPHTFGHQVYDASTSCETFHPVIEDVVIH